MIGNFGQNKTNILYFLPRPSSLFKKRTFPRHCASTLCSHLKTHFKRNFDQNMLENALFLKKKTKKSPQCWGLRPQNPKLLLPITCFSYFKITTCYLILEWWL